MFDSQLEIGVCPRCRRADLTVIDTQSGLFCPCCQLVYPVYDDVPFLSAEYAIPFDAWFIGNRGGTEDGRLTSEKC